MASNPATDYWDGTRRDENLPAIPGFSSFPSPEANADLWPVNPRHAVVSLGVGWRYMASSDALSPSQPDGLAGSPNATPPDPGYDSAGVPSFEFVREKIETRYRTSL